MNDGSATQASGWIEAGLYVVCIAILSVIYAVAAAKGAHTAVFILYSLVISAVALLAFTGPGGDARAIMLDPASWLVGLANMAVEGGYALLLTYVAPAQGSLMIRMSIPITLLIGVVMFGRRPPVAVWFGATLVGVVVAGLMAQVETSLIVPVFASAAACGIAVGVRAFASEFHQWNRAAKTITEKIQVTALVTLVTAIAGMAAIGALMAAIAGGLMAPTPIVPTPADLWHPPTLVLALLVGGALFTGMTYLSFSSVVKIRSENFIATSAFMPLVTFGMQTLAAALGIIALPFFDWRLFPAIALVIGGVLLMIWAGRKS